MDFLFCILYLVVMSVVVFLVGRFFPRKWIKEEKFPFKSFKFEKQGKIYEKLKIKKWKTRLPDASLILNKIFRKRMPVKRIRDLKKSSANVLVKETCVAEATHFWAGILGFLCVKIWKSAGGYIISAAYFLLNVPFILIQRYNRPRLLKVKVCQS